MITRILFESLWLLAVAWVVAEFILIVVWSWRRSRRAAYCVYGGFAAAPLLFIASVLIVTPREQLIQLCMELSGYVDDGNVAAIERHLASDFEAGRLDRNGFIKRLEQSLSRYRVDDPRLRRFQVSFPEAHRGTVVFQASARVRSPDLVYDWIVSRWRLHCRRTADRWQVIKLESLPTPPLNMSLVEDWLR